MKIATYQNSVTASKHAQIVDPATLSRDLGGKWHRSYGVAPRPVCQSSRRKDQNVLTIQAKDEHLLVHCKKNGCYFRDILKSAGTFAGTVEIDQMALAAAEKARAKQTTKLKARARSLWDFGETINSTKGEEYLRARGIAFDLLDTLRWLPDTCHGPSSR